VSCCDRPDCDWPCPHLHGDEIGERAAYQAIAVAALLRDGVTNEDILTRPIMELVRPEHEELARRLGFDE
jgi:hypothetical protein